MKNKDLEREQEIRGLGDRGNLEDFPTRMPDPADLAINSIMEFGDGKVTPATTVPGTAGGSSALPNPGTSIPGITGDGRPSYAGTFDEQLQDLYNQIANGKDFSYDVNADPLYQQYKDQYIQQGKLAMRDTMGKAAALTGGYGSSYGQQVGQQAYDAYLQDLSAQIPELYGAALDKYNMDQNRLLQQYNLLGQQRDTEYGRYRDELNDWLTERNWQRQLETDQYNQQQQAYANLYALIMSSGYSPTDEELAAAGMTREAADSLRNEYTRQTTPKTTSSSGGGGGGRSGGGSSYRSGADVLAIQQQLNAMGAGLVEDGIWGPKTQAAYEKYMGGGSSTSGNGTTSTGSAVTPSEAMNEYKRQLQAGLITQEEFNLLVAALWSSLGSHH